MAYGVQKNMEIGETKCPLNGDLRPCLFSNEEEQGSLDGLVLGAKKVADRWQRFFSMILWCSVD
jgi:hypothetical protein